MKGSFIRTFGMALGAAAMLLAGAGLARAEDTVTVKIPFAFVANGVQLPAGDYVITRDAGSGNLFSIATRQGQRVALVMSVPPATRAAGATPAVEFEHVGTRMRLSAVKFR